MTKFEIKYKDNHGDWQHLPGSDSTSFFESKDDAIDYINDEILRGKWDHEWADMNPDDIEVFEIEI